MPPSKPLWAKLVSYAKNRKQEAVDKEVLLSEDSRVLSSDNSHLAETDILWHTVCFSVCYSDVDYYYYNFIIQGAVANNHFPFLKISEKKTVR